MSSGAVVIGALRVKFAMIQRFLYEQERMQERLLSNCVDEEPHRALGKYQLPYFFGYKTEVFPFKTIPKI